MRTPSPQRRRGASVLEAALVLPILLSLTFGCIEFGHFFFVSHTLQGAAREGARVAIVPGATNSEVTSAVSAAMTAAGMGAKPYTVAIRNSGDTSNVNVATLNAGDGVLVRVDCRWSDVGLRPMMLMDGAKRPRGQTVMRKE